MLPPRLVYPGWRYRHRDLDHCEVHHEMYTGRSPHFYKQRNCSFCHDASSRETNQRGSDRLDLSWINLHPFESIVEEDVNRAACVNQDPFYQKVSNGKVHHYRVIVRIRDVRTLIGLREGDNSIIIRITSLLANLSRKHLPDICFSRLRGVATRGGSSRDDVIDIHIWFFLMVPNGHRLDSFLNWSSFFSFSPDKLAKLALLD